MLDDPNFAIAAMLAVAAVLAALVAVWPARSKLPGQSLRNPRYGTPRTGIKWSDGRPYHD